ncbi:MAG TPA: hypothetical protein VHC68_01320 [Candidatus Paceibacterota bacterium]|nr:hypothetical protein [Candidatus Paceibacterota bacterium]
MARPGLALLDTLDTPAKIQDFLDRLPMNWEKSGETHRSALAALSARKAHCIEGALIAAAALKRHGKPPLIMDLYAVEGAGDVDHVVALYKRRGRWGAISKTNHATIRYRDPAYKTLRELALSYFHEWFLNTSGVKTLESYSRPLNLDRVKLDWLAGAEDLWELDDLLNALPHYRLLPGKERAYLRRADAMELKAGRLEEWPKRDPRT